MKAISLCNVLWLMLIVCPALGDPIINIDTQYMLNTNATRRIPILVSTNTHEQVDGVNLAVQIGDGGAVNGGSNTTPRITNLDIIGPGTIFNASNTGSTPQYLGSGGNPPYLIATADTTTASGYLEANGMLAYLTVNPSGASVGSYQIKLQNVGNNITSGPWDTDFAGTPALFQEDFYIQIVNLHEMKWNAAANGAWTDATWNNSAPPFPNYTAQAVVDTPYTVDVTSAQEADSLALSGGGKVAISSSGSLAITNGVTVSAGGTLSIAAGSGLSATGIQLNGGTLSGSGSISPSVTVGGGTLSTPNGSDNLILSASVGGTGGLIKTGSGTATLSGNATYAGNTTISAGRLQVNGLNSALHSVTGAGTLGVGNDTTPSIVSADSIQIGTLTIGAGSKFTLNPLPGPLSGSINLTSVPEPSTITLIILAAMGIFCYHRKYFKHL